MSVDPAVIKFPPIKTLRKELSFINQDEEIKANSLIDELFVELTGDPLEFRPGGYLVALKIYIRPEEISSGVGKDGKPWTLIRPITTRDDDKYQSVAALVVAVGPDVYKGTLPDGSPRYLHPWCKPGDWVVIPRYESFAINYRGVAMALLPDDKIMAVIADPAHVSAINSLENRV